MSVVISLTPKEIAYYTVLAKLVCGEVIKLIEPADYEIGKPAYYIIAGVAADRRRIQDADLSSYAVVTSNRDKTTPISPSYYNSDEGKHFIRSLMDAGWTRQMLLTTTS